ncbi:hypothetical protein EGW08_010624, partial [Elysia chlorotica]
TWHINVNWNDSVTASDHSIGVMIITSTISTASHGNDPPWLWHLSRSHFISKGSSNNKNIRLPWTGPENNTKPIHIVAGPSKVHHLHSTAGQTKSHWPH